MILNGKILFSDGGTWCTSDNPYLSADIAAMRRIIKTPVWTWEDKKDGRLPEVGCEVLNTDISISRYVLCEVIHVNADVVIVYNGELSQTYPHVAFVCAFNPIETPAEKAQRERDEWIDNACSFICFYDIGIVDAIKSLEITYDKLKSGELPMPKKYGE